MLIFHSYVSLSEGINHFPKVQTPGIRLYPGDRGASLTRWCRHRRPCQRPCLGARFFKRNDEARWTKPGTMASPCFYMEYRCTYGVLYIFIYTIYTYLYIQYVFLMCFFSEGQVLAQDHNLKPVDELGPLSANHGCGFFSLQLDGWNYITPQV